MAFGQAFWILVIELTSIFKPCWTIRSLIWLFSFMNSHEMSIEFSFRAESCWTKRASKWFFINFENCLCTKDFETYGTFKFTFLLMNTQNMVLDNKFCSMKLHKWTFCKSGSSQHWQLSTKGRSNLHNAPELLLLLPKKHNDS